MVTPLRIRTKSAALCIAVAVIAAAGCSHGGDGSTDGPHEGETPDAAASSPDTSGSTSADKPSDAPTTTPDDESTTGGRSGAPQSPSSAKTGTDKPAASGTAETSKPDGSGKTTDGPASGSTNGAPDDEATGVSPSASQKETAASDNSFSVTLPKGWQDVTKDVPGHVLAARAPKSEGRVHSNVTVREIDAQGRDAATIARDLTTISGGQDAAQMLPDRQVGGETAAGFTSARDINGISLAQTTWVVVHDGQGYAVVATSSRGAKDTVQNDAATMLDSWSWS